MKVLVFSDSHGCVRNMIKAIDEHKEIKKVIHLGDVLKDVYELQRNFQDLDIEFVKGNNDWRSDVRESKVIDVYGRKIFITHGHNFLPGMESSFRRGK